MVTNHKGIYIFLLFQAHYCTHLKKKNASPLFNDFLHEISLNLIFKFFFFLIYKETHKLLYTTGEMVIYAFLIRFFSLYDQNM